MSVMESISVHLVSLSSSSLSCPVSKKYIAYCSSGYHSVIGSSVLRLNGFDVVDIVGGFAAISVYAPNMTMTEAVSNTSLL